MKILAEPFLQESSGQTMDTGMDNSKIGVIMSADKQGLRVACDKGSLLITSLQIPGKKMTAMASLLNAYKDQFLPGQQFDL